MKAKIEILTNQATISMNIVLIVSPGIYIRIQSNENNAKDFLAHTPIPTPTVLIKVL